jgi:hypothetical protein
VSMKTEEGHDRWQIWRRKTDLAPKELSPKTKPNPDGGDDSTDRRSQHSGSGSDDDAILGGRGINRTRRRGLEKNSTQEKPQAKTA